MPQKYPRRMYLNPFFVRVPFLGTLLSLEADEPPFHTSIYLHIHTCLSAEQRFYISPSVEVVVVFSINHRNNYIIKKTALEPIFCEEYIYGLTLIFRSRLKRHFKRVFACIKNRSVCRIEVLYLSICLMSCVGLNRPQRHLYHQEGCN